MFFNKKIEKDKIKTWFVTGASSGLGKELCKQLLDRGYNVIAVSRRLPDFSSDKALCLSVDVTNPAEIKEAINKSIEKFGRIDVLSNNAGISSYLTFEEESPEKVRKVMETNFWGTYNTCHALINHFRENNNGTILNMSSACGIFYRAYGAAYVSSKHALEGLTSVLWYECKRFCRVMAIELSLFENTEIGKDEIKGVTQYDCYKNIKPQPINYHRIFQNDISVAVKFIIEETEKEHMQRRLMLGKDIIPKIKYEINSLNNDLKKSKRRAISCASYKKVFEKIKKFFIKK